MKHKNIVEYINYGIDILLGITAAALGILFRFDVRFYYACVLILAVSGIVNLAFIAIKEAMSYEAKRFLPVLYAGHVVIGVLCYYLVEYIRGYDDFVWLYWTGFIIGIIVSFLIFSFLETKEKKDKERAKGPRFIVNKK